MEQILRTTFDVITSSSSVNHRAEREVSLEAAAAGEKLLGSRNSNGLGRGLHCSAAGSLAELWCVWRRGARNTVCPKLTLLTK